MNKGFQDKLQQYAPPAPEGTWDAIEASLNEGASFASRLQSFETPPPPATWNKIISQLPARARVKPLWKKLLPYGMAAGLLAFVVLIGNLLNSSSTSDTAVGVPDNPSNNSELLKETSPSYTVSGPQQKTAEQGDYSSSPNRNTTSYKPSGTRYEDMPGMAYASFTELPDFIPDHAETKPSITTEYADKYMVHTDENGNAVRVPKKIFDLVDCVKADQVCKDRIELLQQKLALSSVTTEFTGLLDLVKNLKENQ